MKFDVKSSMKTIQNDGMQLLELGAGAIAAKKFLDFEKLMPNANPDAFYIKNQGAVKFFGALLLPGLLGVKNPHIKNIAQGVAFEGMLSAARQYTTNKTTGKAFFEPLGELDEMSGDDDMLQGYVDEYPTGVGYGAGEPYVERMSAVAGGEMTGAMSGVAWGDDMAGDGDDW